MRDGTRFTTQQMGPISEGFSGRVLAEPGPTRPVGERYRREMRLYERELERRATPARASRTERPAAAERLGIELGQREPDETGSAGLRRMRERYGVTIGDG